MLQIDYHDQISSPSKHLKIRHSSNQQKFATRFSNSIYQFTKGLILGSLIAVIMIIATSLDENEKFPEAPKYMYKEIAEKHEMKDSIDIDVDMDITNSKESELKLDFLLAGFPKTGSTSFLHLFQNNSETNVLQKEMCKFTSDEQISNLSKLLETIPIKSETTLKGIKCPVAMWNIKGLSKLQDIKGDLKILIGLRHPVSWFQSFYNYRITEMHDKDKIIVPPQPETLIWPETWKGVTTGGSRYDIALMQLGKVELSAQDLSLMGKRNRRIFPSSFKIFLYDIKQLSGKNEETSRLFRKDLQKFLGLKQEINQIPVSNKNHFTRENKHPETINICSPKYNKLRIELVKNGKDSSQWIRSKFIDHKDVTVGGESDFLNILDSWGDDPCLSILKATKK